MKISYDFGHMEGGEDGSASGILYEYQVVRDYGSVCIRYLEQAGNECINCTPPDSSMSLGESLAYRVERANESGSDLHLCFHANCFNGEAYGAEIEVASDKGDTAAQPVLEKICSLGFAGRGIKRPSLYVTKHTNMTAILIEPFFIDNEGDCNMYNPETLGKAIAEGILGHDIQKPQPEPVQEVKNLNWKEVLQKVSANPTEWENGINAAVNAADADGNLGALEIFKFLPELIEKIANMKA